jgi:hypothetical protein
MTAARNQAIPRKMRPVFVMGCHRSGTNLLYDTLLSAGGFAVYRGYLPVYKMLIPRCGSLSKPENRKKLMEIWLRSKGFRKSGLDSEQLTARVLRDCRTGGDFIRAVMDEIARQQNAARWALYDADNVLYVSRIKADIPEALFVHIVRDGRDVALSLRKMGEFRPLPWNRRPGTLLETALYWQWMVRKGQEYGRQIPEDYIEVHYEDLVSAPAETLATLGQFLDHDLDPERISRAGLGRVREPNSSFQKEESQQNRYKPINRWKDKLSRPEVAGIEALVGNCLEQLGYGLTVPEEERKLSLKERCLRAAYPGFLNAKLWLKVETPVGRLANLAPLELADPAPLPDSVP